MKLRSIALVLALPLFLIAVESQSDSPEYIRQHTHVSPEEIQRQLDEAQAQFDNALTLFNPWYTGPLLTSSASMMPPGYAMMQPYLYFTDTYAAFDDDRKSVDIPNRFQIQAVPILVQVGVTPSVDAQVTMSAATTWSQHHNGGGFQDISAKAGFLIARQQLYTPQFKFAISQSFPTGKYKNLNTNGIGLDSTGAGAWGTTFSLLMGKLLFWDTQHPFNTRLALGYTVFTSVKVTNFNTYGGGFGTKGTVSPGNSFSADLGLEVSISQPWVAALDIAYSCSGPTHFHGDPGVTAAGTPASVGGGYSDQLSLAPAIEYNFNADMGLVGGVWFSVYGRNSSNFVSGVVAWYWGFPSD